MTYSDNLEKLRQAGVIDCELKFGTKILRLAPNIFDAITGIYIGVPGNVYKTRRGYLDIDIQKDEIKILGHQLTIGRVLWWIEKTTWCIDNVELDVYARVENTGKIMDRRHNKDLPLDDQENREEIAEFLVSLIR